LTAGVIRAASAPILVSASSAEASTASSITLPATRITNRSPRPWSKTSSGGTRLSAQEMMVANGFWPPASDLRRARSASGCSTRPAT
jgi:hypothetical protein